MAYGTESFEGRGQRGGRLQDDSRAYRSEVEEEPSDLDAPASDGLDDDELEDVEVSGVALDDEGEEDEDDDKEAASPLAEDAVTSEDVEEDGDGAEASETVEEEEETEGRVARRGRTQVLMSAGERRREFPAAVKTTARAAKSGGKRRPAKRAVTR